MKEHVEIICIRGKKLVSKNNVKCTPMGIHYFVQVHFAPLKTKKAKDIDEIILGSDEGFESVTCTRIENANPKQITLITFKIPGSFNLLTFTHSQNWFEGMLFNRKALKDVDRTKKNLPIMEK